MASITIRNLDPKLKERLRLRAARHGHSMENEARRILHIALSANEDQSGRAFLDSIRAKVEKLGGIEFELPPREPAREPPSFE
jgi:antitoxin FitA